MHWDRKRIIVSVVLAAILLFAMLTIGFGNGGIHGTSVCEWNRIVPDRSETYSGKQLGKSRPVRGDEWAVSMPFILAQCESNDFFPRFNRQVNGGTDMMLQTPCAPVWDWTALGQFHNWGYFLFGARHGIAWAWWSRFILLPLFAFLFLIRWCEDDLTLAVVGAAAITLGAPTQWWDTTIPYHLAYFFGILVFTRQVFSAKKWWGILASTAGLFVMLASYCFVMYVPFSLLLLPPLAILLVGEYQAGTGEHKPFRTVLFATAFCALAAELAYFFCAHKETLEIIGNSAYPGKRFFHGGDTRFICERTLLDWLSFCSPFIQHHPRFNECQAAEYIGLAIPAIVAIPWMIFKRLRCGLLSALIVYAIILYSWGTFYWPDLLARWTGLSHIPPQRATVIAGLVVVLCALKIAKTTSSECKPPFWLALSAIAIFLTTRIFAFCKADGIWNWFFATGKTMLFLEAAAALTLIAVWGIARGRKKLFAASLLVFSVVTGACIHPLSEGVSPIYDKDLSREILKIGQASPGFWISNDRCLGQLPVALGMNAYSGTQPYCNDAFWCIVDPEQKHKGVWNRYGHRFPVDLEGRQRPDNRKIGDCIFFSLDEEKVRQLGIRYILWRGKPLNLPWLDLLASIRSDYIYEVKPITDSAATPASQATPEKTNEESIK